MCGVPFLAPWANRVETDAYWLNGKKYLLNPDLGNVRPDKNKIALHGFLTYSTAWTLVSTSADGHSASATSRLEFWKYPEMMAQFPFAHTITMTYRLADGALEVETALQNLSTEPMPVAIGFHPFFNVPDSPRDQWKVHLAARDHLVLTNPLVPTGERKPVEFADPLPLQGVQLDDVFTNLVRGPDGRAQFWVEGKRRGLRSLTGRSFRWRWCMRRRGAIRLLRAYGGNHQRLQPGARGTLQGVAEHSRRRPVERELLDHALGVLNSSQPESTHAYSGSTNRRNWH